MNDEVSGEGNYLVSEQALALMAEVQSTFCAGAWIAVIILAITVADAHLRETEAPGFAGNMKRLIETAGANPHLQQLRLRRNALIHLSPDNPTITVDQQWDSRAGGRTLPQPPAENHLAERRYVSVVLRLVLDQHGQMLHGEVVYDGGMILLGCHAEPLPKSDPRPRPFVPRVPAPRRQPF